MASLVEEFDEFVKPKSKLRCKVCNIPEWSEAIDTLGSRGHSIRSIARFATMKGFPVAEETARRHVSRECRPNVTG